VNRPPGALSADQMLAQARSRLQRLTPAQAHDAVDAGALLVDIRPGWQRVEGEVPGALLVERNHLEWRFDPECSARLPQATGYDLQVIVMCLEGYTSSLAADSLRTLGLHRATDVIGGFRAWIAQGLPVHQPRYPADAQCLTSPTRSVERTGEQEK